MQWMRISFEQSTLGKRGGREGGSNEAWGKKSRLKMYMIVRICKNKKTREGVGRNHGEFARDIGEVGAIR